MDVLANLQPDTSGVTFVSTGRLPMSEMVQALVDEAHTRFKDNGRESGWSQPGHRTALRRGSSHRGERRR